MRSFGFLKLLPPAGRSWIPEKMHTRTWSGFCHILLALTNERKGRNFFEIPAKTSATSIGTASSRLFWLIRSVHSLLPLAALTSLTTHAADFRSGIGGLRSRNAACGSGTPTPPVAEMGGVEEAGETSDASVSAPQRRLSQMEYGPPIPPRGLLMVCGHPVFQGGMAFCCIGES